MACVRACILSMCAVCSGDRRLFCFFRVATRHGNASILSIDLRASPSLYVTLYSPLRKVWRRAEWVLISYLPVLLPLFHVTTQFHLDIHQGHNWLPIFVIYCGIRNICDIHALYCIRPPAQAQTMRRKTSARNRFSATTTTTLPTLAPIPCPSAQRTRPRVPRGPGAAVDHLASRGTPGQLAAAAPPAVIPFRQWVCSPLGRRLGHLRGLLRARMERGR